MSGDGSARRYVSTFRMHIKPRRCPPAAAMATTDRSTHWSDHTGLPSPGKRLEPPVFAQPLQDCCVDEGRDILLGGALTGSQPIKVSWLHNGEAARFGTASFVGGRVQLLVRECLPEDAGAYTCLAENAAGKTSCCAAVFVRDLETICGVQLLRMQTAKRSMENGGSAAKCQSPTGAATPRPLTSPRDVVPKKPISSGAARRPCFLDPPHNLEVTAGQEARISCSFSGSPPIAACWLRGKVQIKNSPECWVESTDHSSTLVIARAQASHAGHYVLLVKDRCSSAQHVTMLAVIDRPQPPASCPLVSCVSLNSLVLSWSGPCYDGGSAVLGYVVEAKSQGGGAWTQLTDQCTSTSYRASAGLRPGGQYCFRVRAYNRAGVSEPGPPSPPVKMEGAHDNKQQEEEEEPAAADYAHVTIDSAHKVTDHYELHEKLGVGKFGQVFKLTHRETGRAYAGKFYKGRRTKERAAARQEIQLMNELHHPKLAQCLAAYDHQPEMVMVMEFIAGGELFERIVDDAFEHTEPASVRYMQQILEGLAYMHHKNIVHLDLKPENIVCVDTTGTSVKIIDFGLACKLDASAPLMVMQGTPEFVAPEVISYEPVCLATDMWSIGVICYILLSGESPFQGNSDAETLAAVTAAQWEFDEESFEQITEEAKDFISLLLTKDTRRRMSCQDALAHRWMAFDCGDPASSKSLSKQKMKRFLARQKWKKAGKAMLALQRMALLSKSDSSSGSPISPGNDSPLSPEAEHALQALEERMQGPPCFSRTLDDQTATVGGAARLCCGLTGYPDPEVVWLRGEEPVMESPTVRIEYEEDGRCTLVLACVAPDDAGVYTCSASNDHGKAHCSATLAVTQ